MKNLLAIFSIRFDQFQEVFWVEVKLVKHITEDWLQQKNAVGKNTN